MVFINSIYYTTNCVVLKNVTKPLQIEGSCLVRIGTIYEIQHYQVKTRAVIPIERHTVLVAVFKKYINDSVWREHYHVHVPSLQTLSSFVLADHSVAVPWPYSKFIPVEEEFDDVTFSSSSSSSDSDSSSYVTTDYEEEED